MFSPDGTLISASAAPHCGDVRARARVCVFVCVCVCVCVCLSVSECSWAICRVSVYLCFPRPMCRVIMPEVITTAQHKGPQELKIVYYAVMNNNKTDKQTYSGANSDSQDRRPRVLS